LIEHGFTSTPTQYRLYGRRMTMLWNLCTAGCIITVCIDLIDIVRFSRETHSVRYREKFYDTTWQSNEKRKRMLRRTGERLTHDLEKVWKLLYFTILAIRNHTLVSCQVIYNGCSTWLTRCTHGSCHVVLILLWSVFGVIWL